MSIGFIMGFDFLFCSSFMNLIKQDFSLSKKNWYSMILL